MNGRKKKKGCFRGKERKKRRESEEEQSKQRRIINRYKVDTIVQVVLKGGKGEQKKGGISRLP